MPVCTYFQNGNCRFGSNCVNEHFDLKQIIKTEVEAALNGFQWPLSCFGPFKEKPCIPNFIEDQSFEEVRLLCYEAKKQNYFPTFQQQFSQQILDAQNKMKALLSLNRDVVNVVIKLYNENSTAGQQKTVGVQSNPFSMAGGNLGGIVQQTTNQSEVIFGNRIKQLNPFVNAASGIQQKIPDNLSNKLGTTAAIKSEQLQHKNPDSKPNAWYNNTLGSNIFASQTVAGTTTSGGNIFAQSFFSNGFPAATKPSIFSNQSATNAFSLNQIGGQNQIVNAVGVFAPQHQQQPQQAQTFSLTNTFSDPQNIGQTNIFAQANTGIGQPTSGGNLFTQQPNKVAGFPGYVQPQLQQQQQQPAMQMGFPQQQSTQNQNIFANPQQQNVFGIIPPQQQQPPAQQQLQKSGNFYDNNWQSGNAFTTQNQQLQTTPAFSFVNQTQQNQPNNIVSPFVQQNVVAQQQQQQQQQQQLSQFQIAQQHQAGGFNSGSVMRDSLYSKIEELKPEDLDAFKSQEFVIGKIPTSPPPRELCK